MCTQMFTLTQRFQEAKMNSKGQLKASKKQMRRNIKYLDDKAIINRPNDKQKLSNLLKIEHIFFFVKKSLEKYEIC